MRGWVEPIVDAVPKGKLTKEWQFPENHELSDEGPVYRLTDSGWNIIHRIFGWILTTCIIALATLIVAVMTLIITINFYI